MGDRSDGEAGAVGAAVEELGEAVQRAREEPEQLELIGMPAAIAPELGDKARASARAGRAGRPPGAQNVATREMKDFCRRVFGYDPMLEGFRWLQHTPESLALVLGCSKLDAFDRLERLRAELMRYFYAPMQPVDQDGHPVPFFQMVIGGAGAPGAAERPPWAYLEADPPPEQNQGVNGAEPGMSHAGTSHGEAK